MTDLLAARAQMAMSLGFHILFAVAGIAMPVLMVIAEDHLDSLCRLFTEPGNASPILNSPVAGSRSSVTSFGFPMRE